MAKYSHNWKGVSFDLLVAESGSKDLILIRMIIIRQRILSDIPRSGSRLRIQAAPVVHQHLIIDPKLTLRHPTQVTLHHDSPGNVGAQYLTWKRFESTVNLCVIRINQNEALTSDKFYIINISNSNGFLVQITDFQLYFNCICKIYTNQVFIKYTCTDLRDSKHIKKFQDISV